ncbi:transposase [Streptomyces sp. NPDC059558]|uniref:transposase n=1 Tax=Streptomyces sp. NPDC059558 TaxID=3346864 RepID=UPI0036D151A2
MLTPGNVNDATAFGQVLDGIRVPRADTGAHARNRPESWATGPTPAERSGICCGVGASPSIPERRDQTANRRRRGRLGGRRPAFDKELYRVYRDRNMVERCFARLKQFRAIATRFDKLADRYRAGVVLASLILWLREPARDHSSDTAQAAGRKPATMATNSSGARMRMFRRTRLGAVEGAAAEAEVLGDGGDGLVVVAAAASPASCRPGLHGAWPRLSQLRGGPVGV